MRYRKIDFGKMLLETLRTYFSVNKFGKVNRLYQYCACLIQPLIAPWATFEQQRGTSGLVANTKWQTGQLTNVLNYLFDPVKNSIYITQITLQIVSATGFAYPAIQQAGAFGGLAIQTRGFNDRADQTPVIINIPSNVNMAAITAIVNQIIVPGIIYEFVIFTPIS